MAAALALLFAMSCTMTAGDGIENRDGPDEPIPTLLFTNIGQPTCVGGTVWGTLTGSAGGGVAVWSGHDLVALATTVEGLPSNHVNDVVKVGDGALAATRSGLAYMDGTRTWSVLTTAPPEEYIDLSSDGITHVALSANGSCYSAPGLTSWSSIQPRQL